MFFYFFYSLKLKVEQISCFALVGIHRYKQVIGKASATYLQYLFIYYLIRKKKNLNNIYPRDE